MGPFKRNLPNILSGLRIFLMIPFILAIKNTDHFLLIISAFSIVLTDYLDGKLARACVQMPVLQDVTASTGRSHFAYRLAAVGNSVEQLRERHARDDGQRTSIHDRRTTRVSQPPVRRLRR